MSLPKEWPYRIKSGNSTIPIYFSRTSKGYDEFKVVWYDGEQKRRFKTFADFLKAKGYASKVNAAITAGDVHALTLTNTDRLIYLRAVDALKGLPTTLDTAAQEYSAARKRLASYSLGEAVDFFLKSRRTTERKQVAHVVAELICEKRKPRKATKRPASKRYLDDLEYRLGRFQDAFHCDICEVQPAQIEEFLNGLKVAGRTYFNYARTILTLFNFAKVKKYYPTDRNPFEGLEDVLEFVDESDVEIFTPKELQTFLSVARPGLVPFLALGAFAGLRHAEITRLDWSDITDTHIRLEREKTKTRQRRLVPVKPNLSKWLADHREKAGRVCSIGNVANAIQSLCVDAKLNWKHNALRHSYISYRFAECKNENEVAMEAGNSPQMIFRHYRELVTEKDAAAWFSILPAAS